MIGTGKTAERGALITAHYTGYLPDGTVFDSSHHHWATADVIGTGRVIKGWDVGVFGWQYAQKISYDSQIEDPANLIAMQVGEVAQTYRASRGMVSAKSVKSHQIQT
ncbi:MAG: FKBP-type peptidyl-prolyl cis-trans isomerase [Moraxella osloensis]